MLLIAASAVVSGCVTPKQPVLLPRTADARAFFSEVQGNFRAIESMKAFASVLYSAPDEDAESIRVAVAYTRPPKLRIKGYKPYSTTLFDFLVADQEWVLYLPPEKRAVKGTVKDMRTLGGPWYAIGMIAMELLGELAEASPEMLGLVKTDREWVLEMSHSEPGAARLTSRLYFDPGDPRVRKGLFLNSAGGVIAQVAFSDYRSLELAWFPSKWEVKIPRTQELLNISFGNIELGAPLSDSAFVIKLPDQVVPEAAR